MPCVHQRLGARRLPTDAYVHTRRLLLPAPIGFGYQVTVILALLSNFLELS